MPNTPRKSASEPDATQLLMADHREVEQLFAQFEQLADRGEDDEKMLVVAQICAALEIHTQLEEEIFYPASRTMLKDQGVVDEALVEHASAKALIAQIKDTVSDEPLYDAKVKVLSEYIKHHVREEETEFFPRVRRSPLDLEDVGRRLAARKQELIAAAAAEAPMDATA